MGSWLGKEGLYNHNFHLQKGQISRCFQPNAKQIINTSWLWTPCQYKNVASINMKQDIQLCSPPSSLNMPFIVPSSLHTACASLSPFYAASVTPSHFPIQFFSCQNGTLSSVLRLLSFRNDVVQTSTPALDVNHKLD